MVSCNLREFLHMLWSLQFKRKSLHSLPRSSHLKLLCNNCDCASIVFTRGAQSAKHSACGVQRYTGARRMGKNISYDTLILPLFVTGAAVVLTLLIFWLWSKHNAGRGSRGTQIVQENGKPVRRSTR